MIYSLEMRRLLRDLRRAGQELSELAQMDPGELTWQQRNDLDALLTHLELETSALRARIGVVLATRAARVDGDQA